MDILSFSYRVCYSEAKMLTKCCLLFALVLTYSLNPVPLVHAQDDNPPGFVSIDCGLPKGSDYKDITTGIYYKSDANLIDSGESINLLPSITSNTVEKYLSNVRSFPQGKKNCYTIQPSPGKGNKYLIRATFMYGNYDSLNQFPTFDLNLGADTWSKIEIQGNLSVERKEIIHILSSDYIHVCLIKTGTTTPFISALELRPLNSTNSMYTTTSGSLQSLYHVDCDTTRPATSISDEFYMYLHFAEVEKLEANQSREFNIYINGERWNRKLVVPTYLAVTTYFAGGPETGNTQYIVSLNRTEDSTHPPIINAYEIYSVKKFSTSGTNETDVAAILNIKSKYGVTRDSWQGDPCEPQDFLWDGLKCTNHSSDSARITTLDLSASGLTGEIDTSIADLTKLETLDLSNNNLSGQVPGFLYRLASLRVLNLKGNNFSGPIPAQLLENKRKGVLSLSFDGTGNDTNTNGPPNDKNTKLCGTEPCQDKSKKQSNKSTPVIVGSVIGSVLFLAAILFGILIMRRRILRDRKTGNQTQVYIGDIEKKNRQFTYSQVLNITGNFQKVLGKGGFGTVYHGYVGDTEVAVKMLSPSSTQGYKEFQTEASLLLSVHHKNLTSLVGYCNKDTNMGIIYEYMANRSLDKHLLGTNNGILSWEIRLQIAVDAAQGLEYLHHGCKPAIIHRDVKTSNILLNEQFQAKLADFGLSRAYSDEGGTHVSTVVAGTPGYLDPDYFISSRLTEKSDVFSFGVVLLEMITGQPAILLRNTDRTHITVWVDSTVKNGHIKQVIDPRFGGDYDVNSIWKAVELALACSSRIASNRPTMNTVVMELKECLAIEIGSHDADPNNSIEIVSMDPESSR